MHASLEKLRTTYIDLLYIHWWDYDTSIEEVMQSLHMLVQAGKVLYLVNGLSIIFLENADLRKGSYGHACMGSRQGERICPLPCSEAILCLSRGLEYHVA